MAQTDYMAPSPGNTVRMAWIACHASYSINGVAALHTEIIKRESAQRVVVRDFSLSALIMQDQWRDSRRWLPSSKSA